MSSIILKKNGFNSFSVKVNNNDEMEQYFGNIYGSRYDYGISAWVFQLNKYEMLKKQIIEKGIFIETDLSLIDLIPTVMIVEINDKLLIKFPYSSIVIDILKSFDGKFIHLQNTWELDVIKKEDLIQKIQNASFYFAYLKYSLDISYSADTDEIVNSISANVEKFQKEKIFEFMGEPQNFFLDIE